MSRALRILLAALVTAALAAPVGAGASTTPTLREERVYFVCAGGDAMKVQNAQEGPTAWSTEAPARSVTAGAGCGRADTFDGALDDDLVATGEFTGNLASLTVELWVLGQHPSFHLYGDAGITVGLAVGDRELIAPGTSVESLPFEVSETGASTKLELTIDGLPADLAAEEGDGQTTRQVTLTIGTLYEDDLAYPWVWGTSEVPAGITFNDQTPASVRVRP